MNLGNRLGTRPCIKLYPQYNSGATMKAMLQGDDAPDPEQNSAQKPPPRIPCSSRKSPVNHAPPLSPPLGGQASKTANTNIGQVAFFEACKEGNLKVVKHCVTKDGADVLKGNSKDGGWTGLHYSAHAGNVSVVRYLLTLPAAKAAVSKRNVYGETPEDIASSALLRRELREFAQTIMCESAKEK